MTPLVAPAYKTALISVRAPLGRIFQKIFHLLLNNCPARGPQVSRIAKAERAHIPWQLVKWQSASHSHTEPSLAFREIIRSKYRLGNYIAHREKLNLNDDVYSS